MLADKQRISRLVKLSTLLYQTHDVIFVYILQVNTEHYVFSTFGVLHVYPDQPSETMSLSDWQREAVLWNAVSKIPFFKNFLVMKMFQK